MLLLTFCCVEPDGRISRPERVGRLALVHPLLVVAVPATGVTGVITGETGVTGVHPVLEVAVPL